MKVQVERCVQKLFVHEEIDKTHLLTFIPFLDHVSSTYLR